MPEIRQLPQNLINQIAAGEVIERPASIVKELLENSVDAGSRRIEVIVEKGGSDLIRISDDGCGMTAEQLPLAIASHATSKLPDDEALFRVQTLGFRGEALASIGSVCHLLIRSRTPDNEGGSELEVRGGVVSGPSPCGCPVGTVMEIRNLFFNTPVRRKFMRTPQTEMGHIVEAFTRLALANPQIHMTLRSGSRELYDLAPTTRWAERIAAFFGGEVSDSLIAVDSDDGQIRIRGYVCDPSVSRGNTRMQYLILNGRHIRDRSLQHALSEAYRGLLMTGRNPICFLKLEIPPEMVDVNVHPTKLEVRFADSGRIYARVLQTLRQKFLTSDLTMRVGPSQPASGPQAGFAEGSASSLPASGTGIGGPHQAPHQGQQPSTPTAIESELGLRAAADDPYRQSVIEWARGTTSPTAGQGLVGQGFGSESTAGNNLGGERHGLPAFRPFGSGPLPAGMTGSAGSEESAFAGTQSTGETFTAAGEPVAAAAGGAVDGASVDPVQVGRQDRAHAPGHYHLGYQVHNRYLVTQDEGGMVVVDQHALHERILYERIREKVLGGTLETQRLLVPEPVSLTPAEREAAIEAADMMAKVGIEIEAFGGDSVLVRTYPAMLSNLPPAEMLRQALDTLLTAGKDPDIRDLLDHLLHSIACKAAVKAGDRLTPEEITSLLEQRDLYHDTHHCPHGRPTALFFSRDELDRMFGRLGPRGKV